MIVASVAGRLCGCDLFACVAHALGSHDLWLMGWSPDDRPVYPLNVSPTSLPCPCLCRTACPLREESLCSCSAAPSRPIRFQSVAIWWFQATHTKLGSLSAHETTPGPFRVSGCYDWPTPHDKRSPSVVLCYIVARALCAATRMDVCFCSLAACLSILRRMRVHSDIPAHTVCLLFVACVGPMSTKIRVVASAHFQLFRFLWNSVCCCA